MAGGDGGFGPLQGGAEAFRGVRWSTARANGCFVSGPTRLYFARLVANTAAQYATLYDTTNAPTVAGQAGPNPITALRDAPGGDAIAFPPLPFLHIGIRYGVYVSYSDTWFTGPITLGFAP